MSALHHWELENFSGVQFGGYTPLPLLAQSSSILIQDESRYVHQQQQQSGAAQFLDVFQTQAPDGDPWSLAMSVPRMDSYNARLSSVPQTQSPAPLLQFGRLALPMQEAAERQHFRFWAHRWYICAADLLLLLSPLVTPRPCLLTVQILKYTRSAKTPSITLIATSWRTHLLRMFGPDLIQKSIQTMWSVLSTVRNVMLFFAVFFGQPQIFENVTLVVRQRQHVTGILTIFFWLLNSFQKRRFSTQEFTRFLSTVSSRCRATRIEISLVSVIFMLRVLLYVVPYELFWNWIGVVRFVSPRARVLIWQRVCYWTLSSLLFGTNCVVVIAEYWSSNHYTNTELIGRIAPWEFQTKLLHYFFLSNNKSNLHFTRDFKFITEWLWGRFLLKQMRRRTDFLIKQNALQERKKGGLSNKMHCLYYYS